MLDQLNKAERLELLRTAATAWSRLAVSCAAGNVKFKNPFAPYGRSRMAGAPELAARRRKAERRRAALASCLRKALGRDLPKPNDAAFVFDYRKPSHYSTLRGGRMVPRTNPKPRTLGKLYNASKGHEEAKRLEAEVHTLIGLRHA